MTEVISQQTAMVNGIEGEPPELVNGESSLNVKLSPTETVKPFTHIASKNYAATQRHYALPGDGEDGDDFYLQPINDSHLFQVRDDKFTTHIVIPSHSDQPDADDDMSFTERVAIGDAGPLPTIATNVASVVEIKSRRRLKSEVELKKRLAPNAYQDRVVCHVTCSKKNFRSYVEYIPKLRPRNFAETCYVLPRRAETSYRTSLDCGSAAAGPPRWYTMIVRKEPDNFRADQWSSCNGDHISRYETTLSRNDDDYDDRESPDINQNIKKQNERNGLPLNGDFVITPRSDDVMTTSDYMSSDDDDRY